MTEVDDASALLERLQQTTPILSASENSEWLRMHPLARTALAKPFAALPAAERLELRRRAAQWLFAQGDIESAARHALAAARAAIAYEWIGEHLYHIAFAGNVAEVLAWLGLLAAGVGEPADARR